MKIRKKTLRKAAVAVALLLVYAACSAFYYQDVLRQKQTYHSLDDFFTQRLEQAVSSPAPPPAPTLADAAPVNVNTADIGLLQLLPGIGPVLAHNILEYRSQNGAFKSIGDLLTVPGIGEAKLEAMRPYVTVGE